MFLTLIAFDLKYLGTVAKGSIRLEISKIFVVTRL